MAHWFGIKPWEIDDFTGEEAGVFLETLAKWQEKKGR